MTSPNELVTEFCRHWTHPDVEQLAGYFAEDAVYHNIPMPPSEGRKAIKEFIAGFSQPSTASTFTYTSNSATMTS